MYCYPCRQKPGLSLNRLHTSITQHKLGNKVQISISEHIFMFSNKMRTEDNQSHQIIIDSGASSITLNSTWKDAIQNITSTSESVLTANGIVNDMIVGQEYINILGIQFKCKYAPKIHKSVVSVGIYPYTASHQYSTPTED